MLCHELKVLNPSVTPPFQLDDENLSETTRLTHRVLDLRRPVMQRNLMLRYRVAMAVRKFLDEHGFIDIETPMLTKSTPEGARDYLVPSRVHDGHFFALPQSPQLFKQLLMVAGFDRYYQITKCFRDEDLRADRQPEFTQIDLETSFLNEDEIMDITEGMAKQVFQDALGVDLGDFPRMPYAEAMFYYGSDKPDMRISLKFTELIDLMKTEEFKVFRGAADMKVKLLIQKAEAAQKLWAAKTALERADVSQYPSAMSQHGTELQVRRRNLFEKIEYTGRYFTRLTKRTQKPIVFQNLT